MANLWISVYEVIEVLSVGDYRSHGLYFRASSAARVAKILAKAGKFKKIKAKLAWGEEDDYGMLKGIFIHTRKVEE